VSEYEPFDALYLRELVREVTPSLLDGYFRPLLVGGDRLPESGPAIVAVNHSGNAFPYDAIILNAVLLRRTGFDPYRAFRITYEKELSLAWWMRPFGIDNFWRRGGAVDMSFDNLDRLLAGGRRAVYYPEGVPGIGKGFWRRYRLQPFRTSFVLLAARYRCPVVPLYTINAEWILPFHFTVPWIDRLMRRVFHVPFLPLPGAALAILFPWAWYLALPARIVYVVGRPIDVAAMADRAGIDPDRPERDALCALAQDVRRLMQVELDRLVVRFGRRPYRIRHLIRRLRTLPVAWPATITRFERDRARSPASNPVLGWLRDWDLAGFYLPFGWPLLSLTRALRRPPYGYRGLSKAEAQERRGEFVWHLAERPLPESADGNSRAREGVPRA